MATTPQELHTILQTFVKNNYTNSLVDNYYDPVTMTVTTPATGEPDRVMQFITETIINIRSKSAFGYNKALDVDTKAELYADIVADMLAAITDLTAVMEAIDAGG